MRLFIIHLNQGVPYRVFKENFSKADPEEEVEGKPL